ncbi:hypothetical protein M758_7G178800 [Ceratodon purpureus]|nr:hypothetical protein M758_7G178800 [Ceratodon purpureus]
MGVKEGGLGCTRMPPSRLHCPPCLSGHRGAISLSLYRCRSSRRLFLWFLHPVIAVRTSQAVLTIFFALTLSALHKAISLQAAADASLAMAGGTASKTEADGSSNVALTKHQQALLGLSGLGRKRGVLERGTELASELKSMGDVRLRPSRMNASPSKPSALPSHSLMVPLHPAQNKGNRGTSVESGFLSLLAGPGSTMSPSSALANPKSSYPSQGSPYSTPGYLTNSVGSPHEIRATPWSRHKSFTLKDDVQSEEKLKKFLSDTDTKLVESVGLTAGATQGFMTPPPTIRGVATAVTTTSPVHTSVSLSTPLSTPVQTLRMSPSQKGITPPKKGENELPSPMSLEEVSEGLHVLGILPYIDQWRDTLRQWFSEILLKPLVYKIDSSHLQVMAAAGKLGQTLTVSPVGGPFKPASANGVSSEWLPAATDEEAMLHQLRAALLQARDATPAPQPGLFGLQSGSKERIVNPLIQECLDAVTEHQRLRLLMKGEWFKGLLPLSGVRPDAIVQRIRELSEGTCVKRYDFMGSGGDSKKPNPELPSDPHLLLYLFCAFLEHPQWMLHVDPYAHSSMQTGTNPLFLNALPGNERYPEKYVAVLCSAPGTIPAGACVLAVGKQVPPVFVLYWDKKQQFSLQGQTALWDSILLLCYRIKIAHGGVVRGISLGSPAYNLLPVLEPTTFRSPLR